MNLDKLSLNRSNAFLNFINYMTKSNPVRNQLDILSFCEELKELVFNKVTTDQLTLNLYSVCSAVSSFYIF